MFSTERLLKAQQKDDKRKNQKASPIQALTTGNTKMEKKKNFLRPPWTRIDEGRQKELDPNFLFLFQLFSDECFVKQRKNLLLLL